MTDFDMRCSEASAREYVKNALTGTTLRKALPSIFCAALITAMIFIGIIGYVMTQNAMMLIVTICAVVMGAGVIIFITMLVRSTAAKLMEAYGKHTGLVCSVGDSSITIVHDNRPVRIIGWESITEMYEGKTAFFIKAGEDQLMILGKDKVLSGSADETGELIAQKLGAAK
ncbi:MAG: hypothetical protein J6O50_16140 [Ruminiclostridium sp.]|nr:hypothetical protein [Ruminiclostridium sp.]